MICFSSGLFVALLPSESNHMKDWRNQRPSYTLRKSSSNST